MVSPPVPELLRELLRETLEAAADTARAAVLGGPPAGPFRWGEADPRPVPVYWHAWREWKRNASWRPDLETPLADALMEVYFPADPGDDAMYRDFLPLTFRRPGHAYTDDPSARSVWTDDPMDDFLEEEYVCWVRWASASVPVPVPGAPPLDVEVRVPGSTALMVSRMDDDWFSAGELVAVTASCGGTPLGAVTVWLDVVPDDGPDGVRVVPERAVHRHPRPPPAGLRALETEAVAALQGMRLPVSDMVSELRRRRV